MRYTIVSVVLFLSLTIRADEIIGDVYSGGGTKIDIEKVIEKGYKFLKSSQNKNGSWTEKVGTKVMEEVVGEKAENVGITCIAGMAFLAGGYIPQKGKYSDVLRKIVDYVLSVQRPSDGYITKNGTRMYEHAFCLLFLAESYGNTHRDKDVKEAIIKAINLLVYAQNTNGGWRYQPQPFDADISVTVSVLQALRAARNAGFYVPSKTIKKAERYVKKSLNPDGSFKYQLVNDAYTRSDSFALAACGAVSLMSLGHYNRQTIKKILDFISNNLPNKRLTGYNFHYFYGHYYAVQAFFLYGGEVWEKYEEKVLSEILEGRNKEGYWVDEVGPVYATSMALIWLQIPKQLLPIFYK
ncbi:MAG: prenyltransferase/squalene oxidase repeat-containing protein [Planctomycetota bacterium]